MAVQRGFWKIDVWKEIVFLVNFGRWDLSCSSEGGIHTYAIHSWVKGTYLLWYIWIQSAPIQTFIWNRVYRSSNRLHVWEIQPLLATQQLKYKRRLHLGMSKNENNPNNAKLYWILLLGFPSNRIYSWNAKLRNLNKRSKRQIRADEKFSCHHQNFPWKHELTLKTFRKFKSSYSQVNSAQKTKLSFWGN